MGTIPRSHGWISLVLTWNHVILGQFGFERLLNKLLLSAETCKKKYLKQGFGHIEGLYPTLGVFLRFKSSPLSTLDGMTCSLSSTCFRSCSLLRQIGLLSLRCKTLHHPVVHALNCQCLAHRYALTALDSILGMPDSFGNLLAWSKFNNQGNP